MKLLLAWFVVASSSFALRQSGPPRPTPEQVPAAVRPYLESTAGLEGLEQSLTTQVAISLGMAAEKDKLERSTRKSCEQFAANWNEQIGALLAALGPEARGRIVGGALFYDTGLRIDREHGTAEVLRSPEFRIVADARCGERLERRRLIAGMCSRAGLPKEVAEQFRATLTKEVGDLGDAEDPWIGHAHSSLLFMTLGEDVWKKYSNEMIEGGTPFGSFDEFQAIMAKHLRTALVDSLRPALPAAESADHNFRYEGDLALLVHAVEKTNWDAPTEFATTNASDHGPILVVEAQQTKSWAANAKHKRVRIGMVAGGSHRVIYDGAWPLR